MKILHISSSSHEQKYVVTFICDISLKLNDTLLLSSVAGNITKDINIADGSFVKITEINILCDNKILKPCKKARKGDMVTVTVISDKPLHFTLLEFVYKVTPEPSITEYTYTQFYTSPRYPINEKYIRSELEDRNAMRSFKKYHDEINDYTEKIFSSDDVKECDHVIPLSKLHKKWYNDPRASYITPEERRSIANNKVNLSLTDHATNHDKGSLTNKEYVKSNQLEKTKKGQIMLTKENAALSFEKNKLNEIFGQAARDELKNNIIPNVATDFILETFHQVQEVRNSDKPIKQAFKDGLQHMEKKAIFSTCCAG